MKIIEIDNPDDVFERALATLFKWKEKQGQDATYKKLATALDDVLVQRRDLVETFCCDIYPSKQININLRLGQEGYGGCLGWFKWIGLTTPILKKPKCVNIMTEIKASTFLCNSFQLGSILNFFTFCGHTPSNSGNP